MDGVTHSGYQSIEANAILLRFEVLLIGCVPYGTQVSPVNRFCLAWGVLLHLLHYCRHLQYCKGLPFGANAAICTRVVY